MLSDFDKSLKPIDDMIIQLKKEGRSVDAIHCSKKYFEKMDSVLQNEARNYAINRRAENYDVESDLCELTNGFPADYVQEIEKSVEEARTEAFVAGAKFILNKYEKK